MSLSVKSAALRAAIAGGLLWLTWAPIAEAEYLGRSLRDAVNELSTDAGIDLVYSSDFVNASQSVKIEPSPGMPLAMLREILDAQGLTLRYAAGTWYVVPGARDEAVSATGTLMITVRDSVDRLRVAGAQIDLAGVDARVEQLADGAFEVDDVPPGVYTIRASAPAYRDGSRRINVQAGKVTTLSIVVYPASAAARLETVIVSTSRYEVLRNPQPLTASLDTEALQLMPHISDDPLRVVHRLPGAASGGLSARVHMRGGAEDETLLVLDGLELVDPFHLRDYQSVFSAIDQRILSQVDVYTGGFPVSYGDALSGVIAMRTLEPEELAHEVTFSFFNAGLLSSGTFADADGEWLISARRGNLDLVLDSIDSSLGDPEYQDGFGRIAWQASDAMRVALNAFAATDDVVVVTEALAAELEEASSRTRNSQLWFTLENEWNRSLHSRSLLSHSQLRNTRRGSYDDPEAVIGSVDDLRELDALAVKQDWTWRSGKRSQTRFGVHWQRLEAHYDYRADAEFFEFSAALAGDPPPLSRRANFDADGEDLGAYFSTRLVPSARWLLEFGLRWDKQTYTSDSDQWSPRVNLLYHAGDNTDLRLSLGRFHQSQRIHELQVEDGVARFFDTQRADQIIAGLEHRFDHGLTLRLEGYRKRLDRPRPRFENLLNPLVLLPELQSDRTRIAPDTAHATGLEVSLTGERWNSPLSWWGAYSLSRAEDEKDGRRTPRSWDQRHSVSLGAAFKSVAWEASVAAAWRSGWPTTAVELEYDDEDAVPVLGQRNAERLGNFQTLDVHVARHFDFPDSRLTVFLDIVNLLNRENPCCVEFDLTDGPDASEILEREVEHWLPMMPSLGLRWQF